MDVEDSVVIKVAMFMVLLLDSKVKDGDVFNHLLVSGRTMEVSKYLVSFSSENELPLNEGNFINAEVYMRCNPAIGYISYETPKNYYELPFESFVCEADHVVIDGKEYTISDKRSNYVGKSSESFGREEEERKRN